MDIGKSKYKEVEVPKEITVCCNSDWRFSDSARPYERYPICNACDRPTILKTIIVKKVVKN